MKKTLVAFYSRTGTTRKVANEIAKSLKCDVDEIIDEKKREGILGYLRSGKDATFKNPAKIKTSKDPSKYDLVVIGTPIWAYNMCSAVRTYITNNKDKFKKVAFFCTQGGSGGSTAFKSIRELCNKAPVLTIEFNAEDVINGDYIISAKAFAKYLKED